jgi:hypothetical protein
LIKKSIDWMKYWKNVWKDFSGNNENSCKNILNTKMINHHNLE